MRLGRKRGQERIGLVENGTTFLHGQRLGEAGVKEMWQDGSCGQRVQCQSLMYLRGGSSTEDKIHFRAWE